MIKNKKFEIKKQKTSDEYYYCKKCKRRFDYDECSQDGAPISGFRTLSPCCERDVHWEDDIEQREENVVETIWIKGSDILKEVKIIDKWHSTHRTKSLIKLLEDIIERGKKK